jgi:hypothetical protein
MGGRIASGGRQSVGWKITSTQALVRIQKLATWRLPPQDRCPESRPSDASRRTVGEQFPGMS